MRRPIDKEIDPIVAVTAFSCDMEKRTGSFKVPGHVEMSLTPIKNPVTGADHFARIVLPGGAKFRSAEMARGTFASRGDGFPMDRDGRYGLPACRAWMGLLAMPSPPNIRIPLPGALTGVKERDAGSGSIGFSLREGRP